MLQGGQGVPGRLPPQGAVHPQDGGLHALLLLAQLVGRLYRALVQGGGGGLEEELEHLYDLPPEELPRPQGLDTVHQVGQVQLHAVWPQARGQTQLPGAQHLDQ